MIAVRQITGPREIPAARGLFAEYAAELGSAGIDLCFQGFEQELSALPGDYAPPGGALFLADADGALAGCIGLRPESADTGELKRLFVRPAHRRGGVGRVLISAAIESARKCGYSALVLDTLAFMKPAVALYESFGFRRIAPYNDNPLEDVLHFGMNLGARE
jgi:GNAT superfamily N-acetyltransferase